MNRFVQILVAVMFLSCCLWAQTSGKPAKMKPDKAAAQSGNAAVEAAIVDLEKQGVEASLKGDSSWAEKNVADDYLGFSGSGVQADKKATVDNLKSGKSKYEKLEITERKVTVYGTTVAVVRGTANVKATFGGQPIDGTFAYSRVWMKRNGKWQTIAFQGTKKP